MHLLSTKQIENREQLENLFKEANFLRHDPWSCGVDPVTLARGLVLGIIKDEGSTRTRVSFEVAMKKLGGDTVLLELDKNSSISKGETIEDTVRTMSEYVDAIVMRHSKKGMVQHCANYSSVPIINAGDGDGEHPTQALLDAYTIWREAGKLDNLNVMLAGDLKCSRTVHSLIHLLSLYPGNRFYLISPEDMQLPQEYKYLGMWYKEHKEMGDVLEDVNIDILYMTRLQKERYLSSGEVAELIKEGKTWYEVPDKKVPYYTLTKNDVFHLPPHCKVLHPLPRNNEIPVSFDSDPRATYFRQAKNGLFVRMALLSNLFHKKDFFARTLTRV